MDSIDYSIKLSKDFGVNQSDALKALDSEVDELRADTFRPNNRKLTYKQALDAAYENLRGWLTNGSEYVVNLNYADIADFAFSHRKACVWAVLNIKAGRVKGE